MYSLISVINVLKVIFIFQGKYGKKRGGAAGRGKSTGGSTLNKSSGFNKWKFKKGGNESSKKKSAASATPSHGGSANRTGGSSSRGRGTAMPGMMPVPVPNRSFLSNAAYSFKWSLPMCDMYIFKVPNDFCVKGASYNFVFNEKSHFKVFTD